MQGFPTHPIGLFQCFVTREEHKRHSPSQNVTRTFQFVIKLANTKRLGSEQGRSVENCSKGKSNKEQHKSKGKTTSRATIHP